jgi:hypothetical protein
MEENDVAQDERRSEVIAWGCLVHRSVISLFKDVKYRQSYEHGMKKNGKDTYENISRDGIGQGRARCCSR